MSISERSRREQILTDQGDIYKRYHALCDSHEFMDDAYRMIKDKRSLIIEGANRKPEEI